MENPETGRILRLKVPYIYVSFGLQRYVATLLESLRKSGCKVHYLEHKGFLHTYYTNVVVEGEEGIVRAFYKTIQEMNDEDQEMIDAE